MKPINRFDVATAIEISDDEIKGRWSEYRAELRSISNSPFYKIARSALGESTRREKFARTIFTATRKILTLHRTQAPTETKLRFPSNFYFHAPSDLHETTDSHDVEIVMVDENQDSSNVVIENLNRIISISTKKWLFIADKTFSQVEIELTLHSLLRIAEHDSEVVFADELGNNSLQPILKTSAVGPHTLLSYNSVGRPTLIDLKLIQKLGGFSKNAGWAFEHDMYLRLNECKAKFQHVPKVLTAGRPNISFSSEHINSSSCDVVNTALVRRNLNAKVRAGEIAGQVNWDINISGNQPTIEILIPTRDRVDILSKCIESVEKLTTYRNYQITILDNDSIEPKTLQYFSETSHRVISCPGEFNYSKIINTGVENSTADYILTLNNDTILETPNWLEQLVGLCSLPDVGIVGTKQINGSRISEHEGISISPYPQHLKSHINYLASDLFINSIRDSSAVTGAVQLVEREFWNELGGMDEQLKVVMNDVDLCLRSLSAGKYVVYTPNVVFQHFAQSTRKNLDPIEDQNIFIRRWDIFGTFRDQFFPESLNLLGKSIVYTDR